MDGFFPTSTPALDEPTRDELSIEINTLQREIERLNGIVSRNATEINDYRLKIVNAGGVIMDYYSENSELTDELKQIGELLGIPMTKMITGTATFEISWSAQVPLDFDADDFEISFSAECESYEADDFDWQEENSEVNAEDGY